MRGKSLSAGISIREFARRDGCSDKLVRRAILAGHLKALADKSLDPQAVGSGWRKANRRAAPDADMSALVDSTLAEQLSGGSLDLASADKVKANALALKHLLAARRAAGELIETQTAEAVLFDQARMAREAWTNWPTRVGPMIATDLGLAPETVVEALTRHVHAQLVDLGEPGPALAHPDPR